MDLLLPQPVSDVDPEAVVADEARPAHDRRPWVFVNMVASVDGAAAVDGLSGGLGGPADKAVFAALRHAADGVLVGLGTAEAERYRPPSSGIPVVLVTGSGRVDTSLPLWGDDEWRPTVLTGRAGAAEVRRRAGADADVVEAGGADADQVDLAAGLAALRRRGHERLLAEGGPSLNGTLIREDLVDEWNLTISPMLVGQDAPRVAHGDGRRRDLRLDRLMTQDGLLFGRWVRTDPWT